MDKPYHPTGEGQPLYVVCAAIRLKNGLIICGARHFDPIMVSVLESLYGDYWDKELSEVDGSEQGFIDQRRNFLTRDEAWKMADSNGQIRYRCGGDKDTLFSENLY